MAPRDEVGFDPLALVAACAVPGLGHFLRGERVRAGCIATGVLGLFTSGLLVGGVDVIDRKEDGVWFMGQALVGPLTFGIDWYHQNHLKVLDADSKRLRSANPDEGRNPATREAIPLAPGQLPPNSKSVGKINELGTLFCAVAGMLNLIVILDAGFPSRRRDNQPKPSSQPPTQSPTQPALAR
jgi:hypothetical protein